MDRKERKGLINLKRNKIHTQIKIKKKLDPYMEILKM